MTDFLINNINFKVSKPFVSPVCVGIRMGTNCVPLLVKGQIKKFHCFPANFTSISCSSETTRGGGLKRYLFLELSGAKYFKQSHSHCFETVIV